MATQEQIDQALKTLRENYYNKSSKPTEDMCVVVRQYLESKPDKIWWYAHEVDRINTPFGFISHRGPARLVDLVDKGICAREKVGRFTVYRLV